MKRPQKPPSILDLYPEDIHESASLLRQAVPLMVRHDVPPNPLHYALWYTYSQGRDLKLKRSLDNSIRDFATIPEETALKLFREHIIHQELEEARIRQQQAAELVDSIEGEVSSNLAQGQAYQLSLDQGLAALHEPMIDDLPGVLNDLQQSTQQMQAEQERFLKRLHAAQDEILNLRGQLQRAQMAANLDGLTQIFNRYAFNQLLEQVLAIGHQGVALLILDIDHFKQFNDHYGHPLGDRVLQHVGQLLRDTLPPKALAARYGGEEFCVILRDNQDAESLLAFAEKLRTKIQALRVKVRRTDKILDSISASFGLAMARPGDDLESLLTRADDALYRAKNSGRNQVYLAS